jgi:hypothetical protein
MRIRTSIVFRDLEDLKTFSSGSFPFDLWGVSFRNDHHVQKCLFAILSKSTAALSYHKYPPASFPSTRPWGFGKTIFTNPKIRHETPRPKERTRKCWAHTPQVPSACLLAWRQSTMHPPIQHKSLRRTRSNKPINRRRNRPPRLTNLSLTLTPFTR